MSRRHSALLALAVLAAACGETKPPAPRAKTPAATAPAKPAAGGKK